MKLRRLPFILPLLLLGISCNRDPKIVSRNYVENGNKYFNSGKYKEASIMYRNALKKDPRNGDAYYRLGLCDLRLGQPGAATRPLRRAVELMPDSLEARLTLADIFLMAVAADSRNAKNLLPEVEELAKPLAKNDAYHGHRLMGLCYLLQNKFKEAIERLEKANQMKPLEPNVAIFLIRALAAEKRTGEAESLAKQLIEKHKEVAAAYNFLYANYIASNRMGDAEAILKLRSANNPNDELALLQLAQFYAASHREADMRATLEKLTSNPKSFPSANRLVGDFYFRNRDLAKAVEYYSAGKSANPSQAAAFDKSIAEVYVAQGKADDALRLLETVIKQDSKDSDAIAMRASLLLRGGKPEQIQSAINDLQGVVRGSPRNFVAQYDLGRALLAKGEVERARAAFEEAIKQRADYLPPRMALAQVYFRQGEHAKAVQAADALLTMEPGHLGARLVRAAALTSMRDFGRARESILETIKLFPNSLEAQLQLAVVNMGEKKFKDAEEEFRQLYEKNPQDLRSLSGLTECYMAQQKQAQALDLIQKEASRNPGRDELILALANVAARAGKTDLAIQQFEILIAKRPKDGLMHMRLGEMYRRAGRLDLSASHFRTAMQLAPDQAAPKLQLAMQLDEQGQRGEARQLYEELLKTQPSNVLVLNNLAYLMAESGTELDQALTLAQRAKQAMPDEINVADTLGWIYIKKNLSDNAIDIYRDLIRRQPQRSTFHYHLGMALFQKGDRVQAKQALLTALRNKPGKDEEAKIRELLGRIG
ncbi:MAG: tetratricopeptide repeat protein [Acidobacteria bacterium]|nr:tetratricopeptide repeat protein [Acidobacteriota bacterium]